MSRLFVASLALVITACSVAPSGPSVADLEKAKGEIHAMQPKAKAIESIKPILGEPAASTETGMSWFAKDGEACKELFVGLMADSVGNVEIRDAACP